MPLKSIVADALARAQRNTDYEDNGWLYVQIDSDYGSREDCSIYYNPVIAVRVPEDRHDQVIGEVEDIIAALRDFDPDERLDGDQRRECVVLALRESGHEASLQSTTVLDWEY